MTQVKIHAEKYENLIDRRGRPVKWQEAIACSCWDATSGQPLYSCQACKGAGYIYKQPVTGEALVTSITMSKDYQEMAGVFEVGDAVLTVPKRIPQAHPTTGIIDRTMATAISNPMFDIGMNDLVTLLDDEYKSSEPLIRGVDLYGRPADTLLNIDVTRVKSVQKANSETGVVTTYVQAGQGVLNPDFQLTANLIDWLPGGNSPVAGGQYSVVYFHRPVYTVFTTLPKPRHQDNQDLPRYVALRYRAGGLDRK